MYVIMDTRSGALLEHHAGVMPAMYQKAGVARRAVRERCQHFAESAVVCKARIVIDAVVLD